jgi:chromodomain-helicase-DNA-binding protein 4
MDGSQEGQVNATSLAHYKDIQRKIVEFIRKRYHLLERCLNLEYAVVPLLHLRVMHPSSDESIFLKPLSQYLCSVSFVKVYFCVLQIKTNTPVPDDLTDQSVPAGPVPPFPDVNELSRELPNLEPICKRSSILSISSVYLCRKTHITCLCAYSVLSFMYFAIFKM